MYVSDTQYVGVSFFKNSVIFATKGGGVECSNNKHHIINKNSIH